MNTEDELLDTIVTQQEELDYYKTQLIETQEKLIDRQESMLRYLERDEKNYKETIE
jgi:hypothetical protein